ncbi:DinB family protein [Nonomuraea sp. NPDC050663]|uniref:DinB family protein n=1 Tax=Nonomuraea sp. NPDC050663 TaxID=3364370 RepID=UPI0037AC1B14
MTWTAPEVTRPQGSLAAPERELLQGLLNWHRTTLLHKCSGLTGKQLAERSVPPSGMSLLGLLRHLTDVERIWFRRRFLGEDIPFAHKKDDNWDADYQETDPDQAEADYAGLLEEWRVCDAAVAGADLDDTFQVGENVSSLRFIYIHLIGEYARHNGHADLLRERVDGTVGA